jgi:hypothetical protein
MWKKNLEKNHKKFDGIFKRKTLMADIAAFTRRASLKGRTRAFDRIRTRIEGCGAILEGVRMHGNYPIAVWSILRPRGILHLTNDPSYLQNCVTMDYLIVHCDDTGHGCEQGLWTLEIPDHALGRLMHRTAEDPTRAIYEAHRSVLRMRLSDVIEDGVIRDAFRFLVPAADGCFISGLVGGFAANDNAFLCHIRADTWIATEMLHEDQHTIVDDGLPGHRLGESFLVPTPLRNVTVDTYTGRIEVTLANVRMPDLKGVALK